MIAGNLRSRGFCRSNRVNRYLLSVSNEGDMKLCDQMETVTISQDHVEAESACPICLIEFQLQESIKRLPCGHLLHSQCMNEWFRRTKTCPMCRHSVG